MQTEKAIDIDAISPEEKIRICREIVDGHSYKKIRFKKPDGKWKYDILDAVTANTLLAVYDALSRENKILFASKHLLVMIDISWRLVS